MAVKIARKSFIKHYLELSGEEIDAEDVPGTYAELFEDFCDPDEFGEELVFMLQASRLTLQEQVEIPAFEFEVLSTQESEEFQVFEADVHVKGDFYLNNHVFILGNLHVDGVIYGNLHCVLVIAGDMQAAGAILIRTYGFVIGKVNISQLCVQAAYGFLMLGAQLSTQVYIQDETVVICALDEDPLDTEISEMEKVKAIYMYLTKSLNSPDFIKSLKALYGVSAIKLDADGSWQFQHQFKQISEGKSLLK